MQDKPKEINTKLGVIELHPDGCFMEGRWNYIELFRYLQEDVPGFCVLCETNQDHVPCSFPSEALPRMLRLAAPPKRQSDDTEPTSLEWVSEVIAIDESEKWYCEIIGFNAQ